RCTHVVSQVVHAPGEEIRARDLGAGRRARSRDVSRQSGVHGDRAAATGVDELQSPARDRDLVGEDVGEPTHAYRRAAAAGVTAIGARSGVWMGLGGGPGSGSSLTTPVMIHHTINTPV